MDAVQNCKVWNPAFIRIFIVGFALNFSQFMSNSLISPYVRELGVTATMIGTVISIYSITAILIRPFGGPAMDYFSRKKLLIIAIIIISFAFFGYSLSGTVTHVMICRILHGVGMGIASPLCMAIAGGTLPRSKMASGIGYYTLAQAISQAVGPNVGLEISRLYGYNTTFCVSAILICTGVFLVTRLDTPVNLNRGKFKIRLNHIIAPAVVAPTVLLTLTSAVYGTISSFIVIYAGLRGIENVGLFFTAYAVCLIVARPICGRIADRFGADRVIIPSVMIYIIALFAISAAETLPVFMICGILAALGYGICGPTVQSLCMQMVSDGERGACSNTNYIGLDIGHMAGPTLGGAIATAVASKSGELAGYIVMYRVLIIPLIIAIILFLLIRPSIMRHVLLQQGN